MSIGSLARVEVGLAALRSQYQQAAGQLALLERQRDEKQEALEKAQEDIQIWTLVQVLFAKASEFARAQLVTKLEQTVTAALQAVFGDDSMEFKVDLRTVGGVPSASWTVVSSYGETIVAANPEDAKGGGVSDTVSLALRLALLELARPKPEGPIILDEPAKMLDRERLPNLAEFLKRFAATTGRSIIMVTHADPLAEAADVSYRVSQTDGRSEVVRL